MRLLPKGEGSTRERWSQELTIVFIKRFVGVLKVSPGGVGDRKLSVTLEGGP